MKQPATINMKRIFSWLIVVIPIIILIIAFANKANEITRPTAQNGALNLSTYNFQEDGNIRLDGEWELYWNQLLEPNDFKTATPPIPSGLIKVPGIWNGLKVGNERLNGKGYATFKLNVKVDPTIKTFALKIITMSNSYKLWVNNVVVAKNGIVGINEHNNVPEYKSQVVPFTTDSSNIEFIVQVSNFYHYKGGIWHPIKMGNYASIAKERDSRIIMEIFLFGCLFIMAIYHFGSFSLRSKDVSILFFGLMCLTVSLRSLFTGENIISLVIPNLDWFVARKIEFILTFASVPAYSAFSRSLYKNEWNKYVFGTIAAIGLALCLFVAITPVYIYTFGSYIFTFYSFVASLYIIFVFIKATFKKQEGAELFLATSLFFLITVVNEILNQTEVVHTGLYLPVGLLLVVFAQSYILSSRSATAFRTTEIYASTFQKFVPKQFLSRIAKEGIESIKPGNAEKGEITVLFSDIRSFTSISEKMSADEVFNMLNEYLSYVEPPISANNGFVDKYMGDGIMALFEKEENNSSSYNAIVAALEMRSALQKYNDFRATESKPSLEMGIGIHTGQVIIGTVGGNERMDSTAIGDSVNLCSRIEGMTKIYGVDILVSGHSISLLDNKSVFLFRFVDYVVAKGKTEPVSIWEVFGKKADPALSIQTQLVTAYDEGMKKYREKNIVEASQLFKTCIELVPGDKVAQIYLSRCNEILEGKNNSGPDTYTRLEEK